MKNLPAVSMISEKCVGGNLPFHLKYQLHEILQQLAAELPDTKLAERERR